MPLNFFEKADAEAGKQKRIGGIASIQTRDREQETILQRGLDFSDFLANGWFNDNHSRETDGVLGYPEMTNYFRKGQRLPNGQVSKAEGHWVEGYLLDTPKANRIWALGKALDKTGRRLGFSVEGKILQRTGPMKRTIAKALVRNVAITNCPVNSDANMEILAKSLQVAETTALSAMEKALGMGTPNPGQAIVGPRSGEDAGQVLTGESLERKQRKLTFEEEEKKKKTNKSLSDSEAFAWLRVRLPNASPEQIGRIITLTRLRKRGGEL